LEFQHAAQVELHVPAGQGNPKHRDGRVRDPVDRIDGGIWIAKQVSLNLQRT